MKCKKCSSTKIRKIWIRPKEAKILVQSMWLSVYQYGTRDVIRNQETSSQAVPSWK